MNIWIYIKAFFVWLWRGLRAWSEVGRRLGQIELGLQEQNTVRKNEVEQLQNAITVAAETDKAEFGRIHRRIRELEELQREQLVNLDRALQNRVDEWARQLSGQMNQLYAAVARNPIETKSG